MKNSEWFKNFPGAITVCDDQGIILEMNDRAAESFADDGGYELIGKNLMACHNARSRRMIQDMLSRHEKNVYTIQKKGKKKLIYQTPWFEGDRFGGLVELSLEIPEDLPHFNRD